MRFWTSDHHFGHANILKYTNRPYTSIEEHNEVLIDKWNSVVAPGDVVTYLGDFALGKIADSLPLVKRLNGYITLVAGNHDRCWIGHSPKHLPWVLTYLDAGFDIVIPEGEAEIFIGDIPVLISHFPYQGDSHDKDRYKEYRPVNDGQWLLHGHTHSEEKIRDRQIHVGVDAWNGFPVSEREIMELINGQS